jgi:hypothetical protein
MSHFDQYNILTDKHHGFRRKRSSETQLVTTIQKIAQNLTVLVKVTHNVAVDDVFKYFTDNRCQGYGSVI